MPDVELARGMDYALMLLPGVRDLVGNPTAGTQVSYFSVVGATSVPRPDVTDVTPGSPTAATEVTIEGTSEPGLSVVIEGVAGEASELIGSAGTFSLVLPLALDQVQAFSVIARDESGNTSEAGSVIVEQDGQGPGVTGIEPGDGVASPDVAVRVSFDERIDFASLAGQLALVDASD